MRDSRWRSTSAAQVVVASALLAGCSDSTDPGSSLRLEALTDTSVSTVVGMAVDPAPTVRVIDESARPVPGVEVSFVASNGGTVSSASVTTGSDGKATAGTWTMGGVSQTYVLRASFGGQGEIVFTAIAEPGPPALMEVSSGNRQTANTGEPIRQPLRVAIRDAFGNRVSRVPVTFAVLSGGGTIDQSLVESDDTGVATSGAWTLGTLPGVQEVRASVNGVHVDFTAIACDPACQSFQLLFVHEGNLYRTNLGGHVTLVAYNVHNVAVSPDGQRIAFVRWDDDGNSELHLMNVDGSDMRLRLRGPHSPTWSPDGRHLAVAGGDCLYTCNLFLLNADDTGPPIGLASEAAQPAWSPDGQQIAYVSLSGDDGYHALHVMNADGSGSRVISPRDPGTIVGSSWSPDGSRIAFSKCIAGACDVHVAMVDGSQIDRRTNTGNALHPAWSPDGSRIAMVLRSGPTGSIAYVDSLTGSNPIVFVSDGWGPVWLPTQPTGGIDQAKSSHKRHD